MWSAGFVIVYSSRDGSLPDSALPDDVDTNSHFRIRAEELGISATAEADVLAIAESLRVEKETKTRGDAH